MFVFVDLETTGLDETKGVILELGIVVTDDSLSEIAAKTWFVWHEGLQRIREEADAPAREMHDKSGLWRACAEEGEPDVAVEVEAIDFLTRNYATGLPMAGNSIHFDRRWLRHHMAMLEKSFFRRSIDVSTLTELARFWAPDVYTNRPHSEDKPHRVYLDIQNSIDQLKYLRQEFLR